MANLHASKCGEEAIGLDTNKKIDRTVKKKVTNNKATSKPTKKKVNKVKSDIPLNDLEDIQSKVTKVEQTKKLSFFKRIFKKKTKESKIPNVDVVNEVAKQRQTNVKNNVATFSYLAGCKLNTDFEVTDSVTYLQWFSTELEIYNFVPFRKLILPNSFISAVNKLIKKAKDNKYSSEAIDMIPSKENKVINKKVVKPAKRKVGTR